MNKENWTSIAYIKKKIFKSLFCVILVFSILKLSGLIYLLIKKDDFDTKIVRSYPQISISSYAKAAEDKSENNDNKEVEKYVKSELSLSAQWQRLKEFEKKLKEREKALKELEKRIDEKIAYEERLKKKIEELLKKVDVVKNKKIKHLVDVYSNMEPQQAARVLEKLDVKLAVKILAGMRGRKAGEILSYMDPNKAALLSKALTEFQTPFGP